MNEGGKYITQLRALPPPSLVPNRSKQEEEVEEGTEEP